jgi:acid phosphatase type 7
MPVRRLFPQPLRRHGPARSPRPSPPAAVVLVLALAACGHAGATYEPAPGAVFFTGAGDIGECGSPGAALTAHLLDGIPGLIWTVGDNAYPAGSHEDFARCYHPTWGRHRDRTRPTPGNHEYWTAAALPYFDYFGEEAGTPGEGWYAYEYGGWRIIALNSNLDAGWGSAQVRWLRSVLSGDPRRCTLAYFHHPLISSGAHGNNADALDLADVRGFWTELYDAGAEIVLAGHDHHYERFAPVNPAGVRDPDRGIRLFIVGTGGGSLRGQGTRRHPASEVFIQGRFGVLKLELRAGGYRWEFLAEDGGVLDRGEGTCR